MILVLSGTSDGRKIIELLFQKGYDVIASTATKYGGILIESDCNVEVISEKMEQDDMEKLIRKRKIECIVDATHPYAEKVSVNAMAACKSTGIKYLRYERKGNSYEKTDGVSCFPDYDKAISYLKGTKGNILLTVGSNNLQLFTSSLEIDRLYARVLPTYSVIKKCEDLRLLPKQIIAAQGPFTEEFNKAMYNNYNIKYMVTKDSGDEGGTEEKIKGAIETGVNVVLIKRPKINYINLYDNIYDIIKVIDKDLKK